MNSKVVKLLAEKEFYMFGEFVASFGNRQFLYPRTRQFLSDPKMFRAIAEEMAKEAAKLKPDVIAGAVTAGVPWATVVAYKLGLSLIYIRKNAGAHGKKSAIEGVLQSGQKVLLIDDASGDGRSKELFIKNIIEAGGKITDTLVIFWTSVPYVPFYKENNITNNVLADHYSIAEYFESHNMYPKELCDKIKHHFEIAPYRQFTDAEMAEVKRLVLKCGKKWHE